MRYLTPQGKGKINWTDYTWNPLGWGCSFGCEYCYARKIAERGMSKCDKCNRFEPHFHPERLDAPKQLKQPARIFPCDMSDLFGRGVYSQWQGMILDVMRDTQHLTYQTLTKQGFTNGNILPHNVHYGVSIATQPMVKEALHILEMSNAKTKWLSCEPLLGKIELPETLDIQWLVIGALSRGAKKIQPEREWVQTILDWADRHAVPVHMKNNLEWTPFREEQAMTVRVLDELFRCAKVAVNQMV